MKYCPHCGLPVHNKHAGICEECGKPLSGSARRREQRTTETVQNDPQAFARELFSDIQSAHHRQKKLMRRFKVISVLVMLVALLFFGYSVFKMVSRTKLRKEVKERMSEHSAPEFSIPEFSRPEISVPEFSFPEFSWPESAAPVHDDPVIPSPGELDGDTGDTSVEETVPPYSVRMTGHEMTTNLFGENVLVLDLEFTNNSDSAVSFFHTLSAKVTQNGTQCMQTASAIDPALTGVNAVEPGAIGKVQLAFVAAPDTETRITVSTWFDKQVVMDESFTS